MYDGACSIDWTSCTQRLDSAEYDVVSILDCCYAGNATDVTTDESLIRFGMVTSDYVAAC